jgi:poly(glycerol-phosphate) alpha-glucosyltransferase
MRASALAEHTEAEVWIDVLACQVRLAHDVAVLKANGDLHPDVKVNSLLHALDASAPTDERAPLKPPADPQLVRVKAAGERQTFQYFRDGILETSVRSDASGIPQYIDSFSPDTVRIRRQELDTAGLLVREVAQPTGPGGMLVHRHFGRDGRCFLTVWQSPVDRQWKMASLFGPVTRQYRDMGHLYQRAFELVLAREEAPVVCSEFRENLPNLPARSLDDVIRAIRHPNLRKLAVVHSNHLQPPYVRGAGVSPNWQRLLDNVDELDSLVVLTDAQKSDLEVDFGVGHLVAVAPQPGPPPVPTLFEPDPNRLVMVARVTPKKRVDLALRVFRRIVDQAPTASLDIFGFGYGDAAEAKVEGLLDELELHRNVRFPAFTANPADIYRSACLTLATSASEGFSLALLESNAHGVPVVAYDSNYGPREVISDGRNGFLVPFGDTEAMAERALRIMTDRELRRRMGEESRRVAARFTVENLVSAWSAILAEPPRPGRPGNPDLGPAVSAAERHGKVLVLRAERSVPDGTRLLLRDRRRGDVATAVLRHGSWAVTLRPRRTSRIFDVTAVLPGTERELRIPFGTLRAAQPHPHEMFATASGYLSVRIAPAGLGAWRRRR